jgi:hypothetical protein
MHLAQFNVARLRHPLDDPRSAEFKDNLELVNGAAKRMPGFVWVLVLVQVGVKVGVGVGVKVGV